MKNFGGQVLLLDRDDINTDEIIPAKYLTEVQKEALKPHLLEDLKCEGFSRQSREFGEARAIVTRKNFGCGSSREHAPWAFEVNGITMVIAENFARIFRQNMFNCGMLAISLPKKNIDSIFELAQCGSLKCSINLDSKKLTVAAQDGHLVSMDFSLANFDEALVRAGGWVEYADKHY